MQVGSSLGWRAAFALEATVMLPLAALALLAPPLAIHGSGVGGGDRKSSRSIDEGDGEAPTAAAGGVAADLGRLCSSRVCVLSIAALSLYNGALGCYSFYGPKAARDIFKLPGKTADLLFGGITGGWAENVCCRHQRMCSSCPLQLDAAPSPCCCPTPPPSAYLPARTRSGDGHGGHAVWWPGAGRHGRQRPQSAAAVRW